MSKVNILVAVNVAAAIKENNLAKYVFMMDSNDYASTTNHAEGTSELTTRVNNGDTVVWTVVSIDPDLDVSILGFGSIHPAKGAIPNMINPQMYPQHGGTVWGGHINEAKNHAQYTMELLVNGQHMIFDPFLTSVNPQ